MRLQGIKAKNFLSLRDCCIADLDPHLNFVVGPNGSGKTSIFRLLRMTRDVFTAAGNGRRATLSQMCTQGTAPQEVDVSVTLEFDTRWEQELISAFLCAALGQPNVLNTALARLKGQSSVQLSRAEHLFFAEWLVHNIRPETVPFFFQGKLRVTYRSDMYDYLRLSYSFICKEEPVTIVMSSLAASDGTFWKGDPPETLTNGPGGGDALLTFLWNPRTHKKPEEGGPLFEFFNQQPDSEAASLDTEAFFLFLADQRGSLQVEPLAPQYASLSTYSRLSQASGIDFGQANGRILTFSALLSLLVDRAYVFTNNVRLPFSAPIALDVNEALSQRVNLDDEQQIPPLLFRLKNGDPAEQARYQRIRESFSTLTGGNRSFDLTVKPPPEQSPGTTLVKLPTLDIRVKDAAGDISLTYQGAGEWEALVLATLLDESEGRLVLLDEPAANLHPGMQHKLIEVLRGAPGQVIVVTHSAHVLPTRADEFQRVYRLQKSHLDTQVFRLGKAFAARPDKLENELRSSSDVAGLLFANGVLLVEGATEVGAFNEWFLQSSAGQGKTLADLNLVLYAVGGKQEFPFYLRFLTAFGAPWMVICDGDALLPNNGRKNLLWEVLQELQLIQEMPRDTSFEMLKGQASQAGIYTYDTKSPTEFETIREVKGFLDTQQVPSGKTAYRGRYIAQRLSCPRVVNELLQQAVQRLTC